MALLPYPPVGVKRIAAIVVVAYKMWQSYRFAPSFSSLKLRMVDDHLYEIILLDPGSKSICTQIGSSSATLEPCMVAVIPSSRFFFVALLVYFIFEIRSRSACVIDGQRQAQVFTPLAAYYISIPTIFCPPSASCFLFPPLHIMHAACRRFAYVRG